MAFQKNHRPWNKGITYLQVSGEKNYNWKGGKPICPNCGKKLASYSSKFCRKHTPFVMTDERKERMVEVQRKTWLGRKFTNEHKKNLSLSHKGQTPPNPYKEGHNPWNKGKRGVMPSPWNKGLHLPEEMKVKISISRKGKSAGENHPLWGKGNPNVRGDKNNNWRGGVTSENEKVRKSAKYILWRKAIFERDGYCCQVCGIIGGALQADHISPFWAFPDLRFDLNNGRTLCKPCHLKTDTWGGKALKFKSNLIKNER